MRGFSSMDGSSGQVAPVTALAAQLRTVDPKVRMCALVSAGVMWP